MLCMVLWYAYYSGFTTFSLQTLTAYLIVFWIGNSLFIVAILSGFNLKLKDPAMSFLQMLWAIATSLVAIANMTELQELIYLLMFTVTVYGIFQLEEKQFIRFSIFVVLGFGVVQFIPFYTGQKEFLNSLFTWLIYSYCVLSLAVLCSSVVRLKQRLKNKNEDLEKAISIKSQFLANMSHEIRTPMNGILGMLGLLNRTKLEEEQKHYAEVAESSAESLLTILNDILDFSKVEAGKLDFEDAPFDPSREIVEVVNVFSQSTVKKGIELVVDIDSNLPSSVVGDCNRLRQVLNNLISNAIKFSEHGEIVVRVTSSQMEEDKCRLEMSVTDTGIGISPENIDKLFNPFTQADSSTTRLYGGTGLGLSIAKQICQLMGGDISVSSKLGEGSVFTFHVWLPVDKANEAIVADLDLSGKQVLLVEQTGTGKNVLEKYCSNLGAKCYSIDDIQSVSTFLSDNPGVENLNAIFVNASTFKSTLLQLEDAQLIGPSASVIVLSSIGENIETGNSKACKKIKTIIKPVTPDKIHGGITGNSTENLGNFKARTKQGEILPFAEKNEIKVILAEDNCVNQEIAKIMLESMGCKVICAENGREVIDMLKQGDDGSYSLVLMDCQMPILDGYQATKAIRSGDAGERLVNIPIIAMTAHAMLGDREKCLAFGMDDYISKPLNPNTLKSIVQKTLERFEEQKQSNGKNKILHDSQYIWDQQEFSERLNNRLDRMNKLISVFLDDLPSKTEKILAAIEQHNNGEVETLAHGLKGATANLSAKSLNLTMSSIERSIKRGEQLPEDITEIIESEVSALHLSLHQFKMQQSAERH